MKSDGFTLIELMICIALAGILVSLGSLAMRGFKDGSLSTPTKESCTSQGGKWTEGVERGGYTQLCTYN